MRKPFIAGNWKMHGSRSHNHTLIEGIKHGIAQCPDLNAIDILVCPPFPYLSEIKQSITGTPILLGAQNLYLDAQGAYTGEVSGNMLVDLGCQYVLVGHSERRTLFHESLGLVAQKFKAAIKANLTPILCIGESPAEHEAGNTQKILATQLDSVIAENGIEAFHHAIIAYEPIWAIGTGLTATPTVAEEVHGFIRQLIAKNNVDIAKTIRILYGGSMKADNAASLLCMPNIDGGLIGGASLDAASFLAICKSAHAEKSVTQT